MNLHSILLRFIARSSNSLVSFIVALDAKLDTFLEQHDVQIAGYESDIKSVVEDVESKVALLRAEAEAEIDVIRKDITDTVHAANVLKKLKAGLSA